MTPEQQKKEDFDKNPEMFIDIRGLIIGAMNSEHGLMVLYHPHLATGANLEILKGRFTRMIDTELNFREMEAAKKNAPKIEVPGVNRLRTFLKGK